MTIALANGVETQTLFDALKNPLWRIENLYWIIDDHGDPVRFKLREVQRDYLAGMWSRNLCPKSRQHGFSTLLLLIGLDECLFVPNTTGATVADKKESAEKLFRTKLKYPWTRMPEQIKERIGLEKETSEELIWGNGSSYAVTTSARSGTLQILHVSEFGKICAKYPEKANEIISGSIPAVVQTGKIHIESTAEGQEGHFYNMVMAAKQRQDQKSPETILDFRLHFFPWWKKPLNVLDPSNVTLTQKMQRYFDGLKKKHGIDLSPSQMAWYVKTQETLGNLMTREHPSFLEESFEAAVDGAILQEEMVHLRNRGAIGKFPYDPRFPVNTFWDFGLTRTSGQTVILYQQRINGLNRFIGCDFGTDIGIGQWVNVLRSKPYTYGKHYMPHDARTKSQGMQVKSRQELFNDKDIFNIEVVPRIDDLWSGVEMLRSFLLTCEIDEKGCADLIKALDSYRREWDDKGGKWKNRPLHNWASDFCDALRQAAQGYTPMIEHYTHQHAQHNVVRDVILEPEVGY